MKKFSLVIEKKRQDLKETELVTERNQYLDFSKKYNKEHGVSGPFDKKFKGDEKAQEKYMQGLSKAWDEYKEKKGIKLKSNSKDFAFKKKMNESKSSDMAKQMIGDGGDPNYHFVTMCDDYMFEKEDAMEKLDAGADLLQLYTGFVYEGPALIKRINKAIVLRK